MASMRQIRSRIRVAKNIQQITKAMKMVAAARLRRAQEAVEASRAYSVALKGVVARLASSVGNNVNHPLLRQPSGVASRIGILVIAGERGLCGSFNSNAIRRVTDLVKGRDIDTVKIVSVGRRGAAFFRRRGFTITAEYPLPATGSSFDTAKAIAESATNLFESGDVDTVYLVYTQFMSAMTQRPQTLQLLPIAPPADALSKLTDAGEVEFEPSPEEILAEMLPRYVNTLVFQAILESTASFFGAQMTSMSSATDNAGKMISGLTLVLNRARQAAITKEIAEIVGGADALRG